MITNENYVDKAEKAIKELSNQKDDYNKKIQIVTTSKIRNLLAMTSDIYNEVLNNSEEKLSEDICARIEYLRVRFIYEAGREPSVKALLNVSSLLDELSQIKGSKKRYILFYRYMESLIAFRKYYYGKDE